MNCRFKRYRTKRRIVKRLPARTKWTSKATKAAKKQAAMKKTKKTVQGTAKDARHNGRWLFAAVRVGTGGHGNAGTLCTHENGLKQFTFKWMPRREYAFRKTPRGTEEMKKALTACVKKKSFLVHDKWLATEKAVKDLKFKSAPSVNHSKGYRLVDSGWHSNDIESEFSRLKGRLRRRYGRLPTNFSEDNSGELFEYMYMTNYRPSWPQMLEVLAMEPEQ